MFPGPGRLMRERLDGQEWTVHHGDVTQTISAGGRAGVATTTNPD